MSTTAPRARLGYLARQQAAKANENASSTPLPRCASLTAHRPESSRRFWTNSREVNGTLETHPRPGSRDDRP